jgi:hypothetical protein
MHGATSGISSGTIQAINQSVYLEDYDKTLGNLAKASYTYMLGDSGGGFAVFQTFWLCRTN